jgi:hypothetical protein
VGREAPISSTLVGGAKFRVYQLAFTPARKPSKPILSANQSRRSRTTKVKTAYTIFVKEEENPWPLMFFQEKFFWKMCQPKKNSFTRVEFLSCQDLVSNFFFTHRNMLSVLTDM